MKIDPGMHIGLHLVFFGKTGVTQHQDQFCDINIKHLEHSFETSETPEIYTCNIHSICCCSLSTPLRATLLHECAPSIRAKIPVHDRRPSDVPPAVDQRPQGAPSWLSSTPLRATLLHECVPSIGAKLPVDDRCPSGVPPVEQRPQGAPSWLPASSARRRPPARHAHGRTTAGGETGDGGGAARARCPLTRGQDRGRAAHARCPGIVLDYSWTETHVTP
jgi:hypothetical protein